MKKYFCVVFRVCFSDFEVMFSVQLFGWRDPFPICLCQIWIKLHLLRLL